MIFSRGCWANKFAYPTLFKHIANLEVKDIHWRREMQSNSQPKSTRKKKPSLLRKARAIHSVETALHLRNHLATRNSNVRFRNGNKFARRFSYKSFRRFANATIIRSNQWRCVSPFSNSTDNNVKRAFEYRNPAFAVPSIK